MHLTKGERKEGKKTYTRRKERRKEGSWKTNSLATACLTHRTASCPRRRKKHSCPKKSEKSHESFFGIFGGMHFYQPLSLHVKYENFGGKNIWESKGTG